MTDVDTSEATRDLTAFITDTAKWKAKGKRVPWEDRSRVVAEHLPEAWAASVDAHVWLADDSILFRLLEDCLKVGQAYAGDGPVANGQRPALDPELARDDYLHLVGLQYSEQPFKDTFRALVRHRRQSFSMATAAIKAHDPKHIGLSRSRVYRLMLDGKPTLDEIALIARAYGKQPEYFTEYRVETIVTALGAALERAAPETSLHLYKKLMAT